MPVSFYEVVWLFMIYSMIGWSAEVIYAALETGKFVNRGFLNGPYCPIYGCGILLVLVTLIPLKENLLILYFGSVVLTSIIEFFTGYILEKVFHNKWWDYSDKPYNIKGYICLKFSLLWGFACTFIVLILHPIIYRLLKFIPIIIGLVLISLLILTFAIDFGITVATILKFNQKLEKLNEIAQKIHHISDEIGENLYENVTEALEKKEKLEEEYGEQMVKISEKREELKMGREVRKIELERLREEYAKMMEERKFGDIRLMRAFPRMTSRYYNETLQKMKSYIEIKKGVHNNERN